MPPTATGVSAILHGTPVPQQPSRKRPVNAAGDGGGGGSVKPRPTGSAPGASSGANPFDFARLWDDEDAAAVAPPAAPATTTTPQIGHGGAGGPPSASTSASSNMRTSSSSKTTPGSHGASSSSSSSRRGAASAESDRERASGSTGRRSTSATRADSALGDADGPEDINELLGLIGDRLSRRFDTKKRKLESFAEKALNEAQKALQEHSKQHHELMEKKIAEHAQVLQGHFAAAATERNRLRQLQESYHRTFTALMVKVEQVDAAIQDEEDRWIVEVQEVNESRRQHLQTLQAQLVDSLKSTRNILRNVDDDQDDAQMLKSSLHTMLANF